METDKRCKHHPELEPKLIVNEPESKHYGKWVCSQCDRWLTHAKRPKTTDEIEERQKTIREILYTLEFDNEEQLHRLLMLYNRPHLGIYQPFYDRMVLLMEDPLNKH